MHLYLSRAESFMVNYNILKTKFKFENHLILMLGALLHINSKKVVDPESIDAIKRYLNSKTSVFSCFRGTNALIIAMLANLQPDDKAFFDKVLVVYDKLKAARFKSGTYLPLAAVNILRRQNERSIEQTIERMAELYQKMKDNHFWLTGQDDYIYAAILATNDKTVEEITGCSEYFYKTLSEKGFSKNNALQSLSHVLAVSEADNEEKVAKVVKIHDILKKSRYHIRYHSLPNLGVLALLGKHPEALAKSAIALSEWLKAHKGFGDFSIDKNMRFSIASAIITDYHMDEHATKLEEMVLTTTIQSLIIAQTIAMSTAIIAATTTASHS